MSDDKQFFKSSITKQEALNLIEEFGSGGGGSGTVTSVSIASTNGFEGTVANPTSTPTITMKTSITGIIKGNGTALEQATADTDYLTPTSDIDGGTF